MHIFRTRFAKDIIAEFLPPSRVTKKQRVIIIASGAPSVPSKKEMLNFFSKKGFWIFNFRYRGTWESGGRFLKISPHQDVLDIIEQLPKGFVEIWNHKKYKFKPDQIIVIGGSFGGPTALIGSLDKRVDKAISISPVIDWTARSIDEPLDKFFSFINEGYGHAFRTDTNAYKKLVSGNFYNPVNYSGKIDPTKNLIFHAKDDRTCLYPVTKKFADKTGIKLISLPKGGHLGSSIIMKPRFYKIFKKFVDEK